MATAFPVVNEGTDRRAAGPPGGQRKEGRNERTNEWTNGKTNEWMNDRFMNAWMHECMTMQRMNEWRKEWVSEWVTNERKNKWKSERKKERKKWAVHGYTNERMNELKSDWSGPWKIELSISEGPSLLWATFSLSYLFSVPLLEISSFCHRFSHQPFSQAPLLWTSSFLGRISGIYRDFTQFSRNHCWRWLFASNVCLVDTGALSKMKQRYTHVTHVTNYSPYFLHFGFVSKYDSQHPGGLLNPPCLLVKSLMSTTTFMKTLVFDG